MALGKNERDGQRRRGRTRKGSPWLCALLVEAAKAAGRSKEIDLTLDTSDLVLYDAARLMNTLDTMLVQVTFTNFELYE